MLSALFPASRTRFGTVSYHLSESWAVPLTPAGKRCPGDCDGHASSYLEHILTVDEAKSRVSRLQVVQRLPWNRNRARGTTESLPTPALLLGVHV